MPQYPDYAGIDPRMMFREGSPYGGPKPTMVATPPGKNPVIAQDYVPTVSNGQEQQVPGYNQNVTGAANPYDFRATPGYEWRFQQGQDALNNSLVGRGMGLSGRAAKEMTRFGQDYGANEYQNVFGRRASIAGLTAPAGQQMNQAGMNFAANTGNALMNQGNAMASAYNQQYGSWNNAIQGGIQNYLLYNGLGG